jgi:NADPH:quinone reductase
MDVTRREPPGSPRLHPSGSLVRSSGPRTWGYGRDVRAVVVTSPGGPENLVVRDVPDPVAGPGELLVRVAAAGVNRADLLQRAGHYPPPPGAPRWPGLEVSGTVVALGPGSDDETFGIGDTVAALLAGGGYAELVAVPRDLALRIPDGLDLVAAAGLPEALATVWSNLQVAHLAPGESLLVRGGSGGIGSIAVQLAHALGVRVFATAGGPERVARVDELGADVALDHRDHDLVQQVLEETDDRGVDVILDVLGAGGLADNLAMLADDGRLVVIGMQKGTRAELDLSVLLRKRASLVGTMLRSRPHEQKAAIVEGVRRNVWPLVEDGSVRPVVHATIPFDRAAEAHRLLEDGEAFGKVLLVP